MSSSQAYRTRAIPSSELHGQLACVHALINLDRSMVETTSIKFADCPEELLVSYVDHGEGVDRAGGTFGRPYLYQYSPTHCRLGDTGPGCPSDTWNRRRLQQCQGFPSACILRLPTRACGARRVPCRRVKPLLAVEANISAFESLATGDTPDRL